MMAIEEAIQIAYQIYISGWETQQQTFRSDPAAARQALEEANVSPCLREYVEKLSTHSTGNVTVTRVLDRSIAMCPHCGASYNAGHFRVRHQDGREVRFDVGLVHYAQAGHPISSQDVNTDTLISMMEDA